MSSVVMLICRLQIGLSSPKLGIVLPSGPKRDPSRWRARLTQILGPGSTRALLTVSESASKVRFHCLPNLRFCGTARKHTSLQTVLASDTPVRLSEHFER